MKHVPIRIVFKSKIDGIENSRSIKGSEANLFNVILGLLWGLSAIGGRKR